MPLARLCAGKRILSPYIFRDMKKVRHLPFVWGEIGERVRDERKRRKIDNFSCLVGLEIGKRESKSVGPIEFWSLSRWAKKYKEGEFSFFTFHLYPSSNFAELFFFLTYYICVNSAYGLREQVVIHITFSLLYIIEFSLIIYFVPNACMNIIIST